MTTAAKAAARRLNGLLNGTPHTNVAKGAKMNKSTSVQEKIMAKVKTAAKSAPAPKAAKTKAEPSTNGHVSTFKPVDTEHMVLAEYNGKPAISFRDKPSDPGYWSFSFTQIKARKLMDAVDAHGADKVGKAIVGFATKGAFTESKLIKAGTFVHEGTGKEYDMIVVGDFSFGKSKARKMAAAINDLGCEKVFKAVAVVAKG